MAWLRAGMNTAWSAPTGREYETLALISVSLGLRIAISVSKPHAVEPSARYHPGDAAAVIASGASRGLDEPTSAKCMYNSRR